MLPEVHKGDALACRTASGSWVPKIAAKSGIHRAEVARNPWPVVSVTDPRTKRTFNWPAEDVLVWPKASVHGNTPTTQTEEE